MWLQRREPERNSAIGIVATALAQVGRDELHGYPPGRSPASPTADRLRAAPATPAEMIRAARGITAVEHRVRGDLAVADLAARAPDDAESRGLGRMGALVRAARRHGRD